MCDCICKSRPRLVNATVEPCQDGDFFFTINNVHKTTFVTSTGVVTFSGYWYPYPSGSVQDNRCSEFSPSSGGNSGSVKITNPGRTLVRAVFNSLGPLVLTTTQLDWESATWSVLSNPGGHSVSMSGTTFTVVNNQSGHTHVYAFEISR